MKIAIISDIHSNLEALTACCKLAKAQGAEKYVCLGDSVGYGPDPVAVLDMLQSLPNLVCVLGNHDEYMFNSIDVDCIPPVRESSEWTSKQLTVAHLDFLKSLPYLQIDNGVSYVHADLVYPGNWGYITNEKQALNCMNAASTNLVFYGHVHIPMVFHEKPDNSIESLQPQHGVAMYLHQNQRYVVNTGSVGQPRDDNSDACFVIYDEEADSITFHRVEYDYEKTIAKIQKHGLPMYFAERLRSGI